ncbi:hypothetical protein [Borrelia hermsii]|uniref:Uncharacterized protein n=2 Tax=Borrelia hermsii TaxID=140 RepID=T1EC98_BORHE|nr:hypothetical protein [Borrelia hermsii]ADN26312.1 hypothetical protein BHA059 [Borrelia hermsii]AMR75894.1 hypothetical protein A0V01_04590 [Borrelia hermsii]ANA43700.1 hypothetical protein AXX13_A0280 [Borrelia hermsii HS1]UCP01925.1 hypothetical protein K9R62_04630 [Borrelia hermsii]UPA08493.1 hypothetical protein bhDAH_001201 [Borrelia hermsii DAH]
MKRADLIMDVAACNLEGNANSGPIGKPFNVKGSDVQQLFNISAKDRAYYALKTRVIAYREELEDACNHFNLGELLFNIPFKQISPDLTVSDKQDKVYAGLGYDVEAIKQLGILFNKLDLNSPHFINTDIDIAHSLLTILNKIVDYARTVVNYYLSDENLIQIKSNKDEARITEIYAHLEEFIDIRKKCISGIKSQLASLESRITRESVLSGIKEIVDNEGEIGRAVSLMGIIAVTIWSLG